MRLNTDYVTYYVGEDIHPKLAEACAWAKENIFDDISKEPFDHPVTLAGGALRSFFLDTPVNDFDLYTTSSHPGISLNHYEEAGKTEKSVMLTRQIVSMKKGLINKKANVINKRFENPISIIDHFDFTVCMCAVTKEGESLSITYHPDYFTDLATRSLRVHNPEDTLNTLWRLQKYNGYGFTINRVELWKIVEALNEYNLPTVGYGMQAELKDGSIPLDQIFGGS